MEVSNGSNSPNVGLIAVGNLREFFHDSVQHALREPRVDIDDHTEHYVVMRDFMNHRTAMLKELMS